MSILNFGSTTIVRSFDQCIYFKKTDVKLSDEHIIPFALQGTLIAANASCEQCSRITSRYELAVCRQMFGDFRDRYNLRSRRRSKKIPYRLISTTDGSSPLERVHIDDFPVVVFVYKFTYPGVLIGIPKNSNYFPWTGYMAAGNNLNELKASQIWDGRSSFKTIPFEFARMLAKIAYSFSVSVFGLNGLIYICRDIILNISDDVGYFVGGYFDINMASSTDDLEDPIDGAGHLLGFSIENLTEDTMALVISIRLFAGLSFPTYQVVVAEINDHSSFAEIVKNKAQEGIFKLDAINP